MEEEDCSSDRSGHDFSGNRIFPGSNTGSSDRGNGRGSAGDSGKNRIRDRASRTDNGISGTGKSSGLPDDGNAGRLCGLCVRKTGG